MRGTMVSRISATPPPLRVEFTCTTLQSGQTVGHLAQLFDGVGTGVFRVAGEQILSRAVIRLTCSPRRRPPVSAGPEVPASTSRQPVAETNSDSK